MDAVAVLELVAGDLQCITIPRFGVVINCGHDVVWVVRDKQVVEWWCGYMC